MIEAGIFGGYFLNNFKSSTFTKEPKKLKWIPHSKEKITCYCDSEIISNLNFPKSKGDIKIAWLLESSFLIPGVFDFIRTNYEMISQKYDFLFSHDSRIFGLADNFHYLPTSGYFINEPQIYPKNKLVSFITSNKSFSPGHRYRLAQLERLKNDVDVFGFDEGFEKKEDGLKDYMFSIVIENSYYVSYWTEKILDAFVTGTIPVYYGSPDIYKYFNHEGIIEYNEGFNINRLSKDLYDSKKDAIQDNYERALKYYTAEDIMVEEFLSKI